MLSLARLFTSMKGHGVKLFPHRSSLQLVLADSSDLEDDESVEDFGDLESESYLENCAVRSQDASFSEGSVQPLLPSDRPSLLAEEVRAKYLVFISSHFLDQNLKFIAQTLSKLKLLLS